MAGRWLRDNTPPDAIVMDNEPWDLHFYSDRKAVHLPHDSMELILWVMRTYGVTYITHTDQLESLYDGEFPVLELVNEEGLKIYKVWYDRLPDQYRAKISEIERSTYQQAGGMFYGAILARN